MVCRRMLECIASIVSAQHSALGMVYDVHGHWLLEQNANGFTLETLFDVFVHFLFIETFLCLHFALFSLFAPSSSSTSTQREWHTHRTIHRSTIYSHHWNDDSVSTFCVPPAIDYSTASTPKYAAASAAMFQ